MENTLSMLIAGGSGLIGKALAEHASAKGWDITILSRSPDRVKAAMPNVSAISWNELNAAFLEGIDAVVNLAGAGIADKRWSASRIETLRKSRVEPSTQLAEAINACEKPPAVLVQGSAIGFYGRTSGPVNEESPAGTTGVLPPMSVEWEAAVKDVTTRVVLLRTGIVLSTLGGALPKMLPPFKMFVGSPLGSGKQIMSWIHLDDQVGLIMHAIENKALSGPLNSVAPNPLSNKAFSKALAKALRRPCLPIGVPGFVLKIMLGQMGQELLLDSQHIESTKNKGYEFRFPEVSAAFADLFA